MNALYEKSGADENISVTPQQLAEAMSLDLPEREWTEHNEDFREYRNVVDYLEGEALIRLLAPKDFPKDLRHLSEVYITHKGIVEVEEALSNPDQPTDHFAPAATVVNIGGSYIGGNVIESQVQQAGPGSTQSITIVDAGTRQDIERFITLLRDEIGQLGLNEDEMREVEAEVRTIEAQLSDPKPKVPITKAALQSIKTVLQGAVTSAASTELVYGVDTLISNLA
jgi:hypothetical protein